jgi:hypothetical protein
MRRASPGRPTGLPPSPPPVASPRTTGPSASTNGANAKSPTSTAVHDPTSVRVPSARGAAVTSATRRVLPAPASPQISTVTARSPAPRRGARRAQQARPPAPQAEGSYPGRTHPFSSSQRPAATARHQLNGGHDALLRLAALAAASRIAPPPPSLTNPPAATHHVRAPRHPHARCPSPHARLQIPRSTSDTRHMSTMEPT